VRERGTSRDLNTMCISRRVSTAVSRKNQKSPMPPITAQPAIATQNRLPNLAKTQQTLRSFRDRS